MGYFSEMKEEVQQFAEVISQALLVESEIIDDDWEVAGSTSCVYQPEKARLETLLNTYGVTLAAKKRIAEELGISLATLYRKLKKYEL